MKFLYRKILIDPHYDIIKSVNNDTFTRRVYSTIGSINILFEIISHI